jgi:hypothetical protein
VTRSFGIGRGIGVRYDATELAVGVTEVPAYGTAVHAEVYRAPDQARRVESRVREEWIVMEAYPAPVSCPVCNTMPRS